MSWHALLRWVLVLLVIGAAYGGFLMQRAQQQVAGWVALLRPHALLRYERLIAWPGGRIDLHDVRLEPVGSWRTALGWPVGHRLEAQRLRIEALEAPGARGFRLEASGLTVAVTGNGPLTRVLSDAGITRFEGTATLRYEVEPAGRHALALDLRWPGQGRLAGELLWLPGPRWPEASLEGLSLVRADLGYHDEGLILALKTGAALRAREPLPVWVQRQAAELDALARRERWTWDAESADLVYALLREPRSVRLRLDPLRPVRLDHLGLYARGDWWQLLGAELRAAP